MRKKMNRSITKDYFVAFNFGYNNFFFTIHHFQNKEAFSHNEAAGVGAGTFSMYIS